MNASIRFTTTLMLGLALVLAVGCSSSIDGCETCDVPAPEPACAPPPAADCAPPAVMPSATPVATRPPTGNAAPGQVWCYVKVPAVVQHVPERVCVRPATVRKEWVPPVQQQVTERVCVRQPTTRQVEIPAQYEQRERQVCVDPGRTEWAKVECATVGCTNPEEELGECWQLQQIPPTYETKVDTVCVRQKSFRTETIPGEYQEQVKVVTVKPGYYRDVPVEPIFEERVKTVVVSPARWEWRRNNVCEVPGAANAYQLDPGTPVAVPETMAPAGTLPADARPATPNVFEPAPTPVQPGVPVPTGNPQAPPTPVGTDLPPAGELPPVPEFGDGE